ncbi:MAG: asparagine synthase (glutamine-hydrolyzing) [Solirubrobacteraceae bacterium]
MCGFCGIVGAAVPGNSGAIVRVMRETLQHRGPDGGGEARLRSARPEVELGGSFGFCRLKVVDLSDRAFQPMFNDDRSVALVFNGEIYNFRELRRELTALGMPIRSTGDTEVVLRAYEAWGEDFLERLDGMFALAVWDAQAPLLLLARDRPGKKPLYYSVSEQGIVFGSEIKAILACPWFHARPDWSRLPELLTFGYVPNPGTMLQGVQQVPPASAVVFDRHGVHPPRSYWSALPQGRMRRVGKDTSEQIAELVDAAVRRRLVADVPVGAFLSGGIDSSLVVGLMAKATPEPVHSFSIGFPDEQSFDERGYARAIAERFGTQHTEFSVEVDAVSLIDRLLWHHDQPFADSSAIPTYVVSQLAREHVTVVLTGDGGDEVFAGYDRFRAAAVSASIPGPVVKAAAAIAPLLPGYGSYHSARRRLERFAAQPEATVQSRYLAWASVTQADVVRELLPKQLGSMAPEAGAASMHEQYALASALPPLDQILFANLTTYLPDDLAVKMDRMTMAHSLEARSPLLDTALIELLAQVPARNKIGLRYPKPLLRKAFGPLLPSWVWRRPKHGFGVPMRHWFAGELGTMFEDEMLASDARCLEVIDPAQLRRLWTAQRAGTAEHSGTLWLLLTLERWMRSLERPPSPQPPADPITGAAENT